MSDFKSLIERVEAASRPDREADLAINLALFPNGEIADLMKYPRGLEGCEGYSWDIRGASVIFEKRTADGRCPHNGGILLPFYTASLNAVMALMPDDNRICWSVMMPTGRIPWGRIWFRETGATISECYAATPTLALLSAILQARSAMEASE